MFNGGYVKNWADRLRGAAIRTLGEVELTRGEAGRFRDEAGSRRAVDEPFMLWRAGVMAEHAPASARDEVRLWWALLDSNVEVDELLIAGGREVVSGTEADGMNAAPMAKSLHGGEGVPGDIERHPPLLAWSAGSVEVFTQTQLCAMHALWHLAAARGRADWRRMCLNAAAWFVEHIQPDNATNHPWGIHVFVMLSAERRGAGDPMSIGLAGEADLYAQAMLHNCQVGMGRADSFSAHVLADAAKALAQACLD